MYKKLKKEYNDLFLKECKWEKIVKDNDTEI